ncbi:MAG: hypothetical protein V3574_04175 [Candidatus Moraniibacteriota bacterium]
MKKNPKKAKDKKENPTLVGIVGFILEKNLFKKNKRRAFFLLLSLAPCGKYVSKFFIRDKIEEAILFGFLSEEIYPILGDHYYENIHTYFHPLVEKGLIEKIDLSQSNSLAFCRNCAKNVRGSYIPCPKNRTQIFYRIAKGRGERKLLEILEGKV